MTSGAQRGVQPNAQQPRVFDARRICPQHPRGHEKRQLEHILSTAVTGVQSLPPISNVAVRCGCAGCGCADTHPSDKSDPRLRPI